MKTAADRTATAAAVRALALVALLAVRAHCALSNGVQDGYYGGGGGGEVRFAKLDRFMHDRLGETPALVADRGHVSRTTAASVAVQPADEDDDLDDDDDDGNEDENEGGGGGGGVDRDDGDDDDDDDDDEDDKDEDPESSRRQPIRLRHSSRREKDDDLYDQHIQNQEPVRTMSPISASKWKHLGSRGAVDKTFRNTHNMVPIQISSQGDNSEVYKHQMRVAKETQCKVPRSRVVKVTDHYPSSNKKYAPSCTVLHQCADDTGCCGSPTLKCGPKSTQPILLHFLVYTSPELTDGLTPNQSYQSYQTLLFYNHTECHCQPKDDDSMPRDTSLMSTAMEAVDPPVVHRTTSNNNRYSNAMGAPKKLTSFFENCKCPTEYTVRYLANGSCACDCFDKQHECIRHKKGNMYFNFLDRYCITSGQCLMPMCEYGLYSHRTGRCPKKFETLNAFKNKHYF